MSYNYLTWNVNKINKTTTEYSMKSNNKAKTTLVGHKYLDVHLTTDRARNETLMLFTLTFAERFGVSSLTLWWRVLFFFLHPSV